MQISSLLTPFLNLPGAQSEHLVLPFLEVRPRAHWSHSEDPSNSDVVLATQFVQSALKVEPLFGFFFPAAHLLQSVALTTPFADEYVPCGHASQAAPAEVRSCASKFGLPYVPAPHEAQTSPLTNFPWVHSSHFFSPYTLVQPSGQVVQILVVEKPTTFGCNMYWPGSH